MRRGGAQIGLPTDCEALLLMEVDGHAAEVDEQAEQILALAKEGGAREVRLAQSADEALRLASARRTAFSALARLAQRSCWKTSPCRGANWRGW